MREGWKEVELGEVSFYVKDKINADKLNSDNYISADNMIGNIGGITSSEYVPESGKSSCFIENDILISNIRPYFKKMWFADFTGGCSNDVFILRVKDKRVDPKFLFYRLSNQDFFDFMMAGANGTKMPRGNKNAIITFKINLSPIKTQKKIAAILSSYDDLIENNLKRIKILEEMAQQTYEEWFVRMRFPGYESATINKKTELPEGWEKVKIEDLCIVSGGGTPSKSNDDYWVDGDINWFTPTDLTKNKSLVITESELKTNSLGIAKSSAKILKSNSFIMTSRATIGVFALLDKSFSTNQGFINITPNNKNLKGYLLYNFLFRMDQLKGLATGATFPELSKSKFKVLDIVKPSEDILDQFSNQFSIITEQLFNLTYQNQRLREARDILLPRLMMGMIEV